MAADADRPRDVLDVLIQEHREVAQLLDTLRLAHDDTERRHVADQVIAHLVRHWVIEESYVHPTVRGYLVDGEELVAHHAAEHAQLEAILRELERLDGGDERFTGLVQDLQSDLVDHIADEETHLFAKLRFAVSADELVKIQESVELSGRFSPPRAPAYDLLLARVQPGEGLVDRIRNALGGSAAS